MVEVEDKERKVEEKGRNDRPARKGIGEGREAKKKRGELPQKAQGNEEVEKKGRKGAAAPRQTGKEVQSFWEVKGKRGKERVRVGKREMGV